MLNIILLSAKFKIFIIDEVHMLSKQAFNGLLKTLRGIPPGKIKIYPSNYGSAKNTRNDFI